MNPRKFESWILPFLKSESWILPFLKFESRIPGLFEIWIQNPWTPPPYRALYRFAISCYSALRMWSWSPYLQESLSTVNDYKAPGKAALTELWAETESQTQELWKEHCMIGWFWSTIKKGYSFTKYSHRFQPCLLLTLYVNWENQCIYVTKP